MEKLLVNLYIPAVDHSYDIRVSREILIKKVIEVIACGVEELSNGKYHVTGKEILAWRDRDMILNPELCMKDYNIVDGSKLVLI